MSANLFGERFMGFRIPAWHNLGTVFNEPISAVEATKAARMDYQVIKAPLVAQVKTLFGDQLVTAPGKFLLLREPTDDNQTFYPFGVVSEDYQIKQNLELAEMLDTLTGGWPLETIGALGNGETVFYTLSVGRGQIGGDDINQYFLVTDTKDGKTSFRIAFTPVRVVCQNTLVSGLAQSTVNVKLSHNKRLEEDLQWRVNLLKDLQNAQNLTMAHFTKLAEIILSDEQIDTVLEAAYPQPARPSKLALADSMDLTGYDAIQAHVGSVSDQWEYYCKLAITRRLEVKERLAKENDSHPDSMNSGWLVYNSVVENEDFRTGPETMFASAVFGERAKTKVKAMAAITNLIK